MKGIKSFVIGVIVAVMICGVAYATPSTQIWIPSTDIQPYKKVHFGADTYIKTASQDGVTELTVTNLGLTVGVLPWEKFQMEIGLDYRDIGGNHTYPMLFNAKIGTPEDALFKYSPALAVGVYDFGTKKDFSDYNIVYGLIAKTIGNLGRLSAGYYTGNDKLLLDINGNKDNHGVLLSWDRTISEISDKLWLAVDYQGGKNGYGALSAAFAWKFAPNVGVIFGYDIYNESFYKPTATIQVDIDF
ncbi:MAG: hypothetical protein A2X96_02000 [Syntrophobacterales bacterium GWC2_56_13]|nr:MAG: hypothetical protein A2X96_02000 [Syntrophobacterales bacterium GWC2_56_13]OHE19625.1 MAG: hypothetical protein A2X95_06545 [Syntrophobacterales bacterium GWF2_56_9]